MKKGTASKPPPPGKNVPPPPGNSGPKPSNQKPPPPPVPSKSKTPPPVASKSKTLPPVASKSKTLPPAPSQSKTPLPVPSKSKTPPAPVPSKNNNSKDKASPKQPTKNNAKPSPSKHPKTSSAKKGGCCKCFKCCKKKPPKERKPGEESFKDRCFNPLCFLSWVVVIVALSMGLYLFFTKCDSDEKEFQTDHKNMTQQQGKFLVVSAVMTYAFILWVIGMSVTFILLTKFSGRQKRLASVKNSLVTIHIFFGAVVAIVLTAFMLKQLTMPEDSCLATCLVYTLVLLPLGVIPFIVFTLVYRKRRLKIHPPPKDKTFDAYAIDRKQPAVFHGMNSRTDMNNNQGKFDGPHPHHRHTVFDGLPLHLLERHHTKHAGAAQGRGGPSMFSQPPSRGFSQPPSPRFDTKFTSSMISARNSRSGSYMPPPPRGPFQDEDDSDPTVFVHVWKIQPF